ncbi:hypothetical protein [Streptomyces sp. NPDC001978]|uniref:hypothetical protein n=1 Tax=Streptomyces sp. NPDC001978 TaxID=3364627 RepID=UPI0036D1272E
MQTLCLEHEPRLRRASSIGMFLLFAALPTVVAGTVSALPITAKVVIGLCSTAAGAYLGIRAERAVVFCQPDEILIRGFIRSRRIRVRDLIGLRGIHLYWCSTRGRLRRSQLASFATSPYASSSVYERNGSYLRRLDEWIEQAVGSSLKRRAKNVQYLDDAALARELQLADAATRWEDRRRRQAPGAARSHWHELRNSAADETAKR